MREGSRGIVIAAVLALGCGASPSPEVGEPEGILDEADTCPPLSSACYDGFDWSDTDGCPDPPRPMRISFEPASSVLSADAQAHIDDIFLRRPPLAAPVRLEVAGYAGPDEEDDVALARAIAVAERLEARGLDPARMTVSSSLPEDIEGSDPEPTYVGITARHCLDE